MYPTIEIFTIQIYTFGTVLASSWFLFFWLLHRYSSRNGIVRPIFQDIFTFTISLFFFSRLFHIFANWVDEKFILLELVHGNFFEFLRLFFAPTDFLFSLFGAIFGFILVFLIKTRHEKSGRHQYIEVIVSAYLGSSLLGYFGALLGGQIYGIPWDSSLSIRYDNPIVLEYGPLFPLPIFYIVLSVGIIYFLRHFDIKWGPPSGFIGYMGIGLISMMIFLGEFLSGKRKDMFYDLTSELSGGYLGMSLSQIGALIGVTIAVICILRLTEKN